MEPDIQIVTTTDGVRIAYAVSGAGPVLVHMPNLGASMLELERRVPERARWSKLLSRRFTLIRYDARGSGYSQREVGDVSVDGHLRDLEAVVAAMRLQPFSLFGFLWSAYVAPCYAARNPGRVSRLILWPPDTRRYSAQEYRSLGELAVSDWETFTETYAHLAMGWERGEAAHRYALIMRESVSREMFIRQLVESRVPMSDLDRLGSRVQVPALVLQRKMKYAAERVARLVAALPGARLQVFGGESTVPYLGDANAVIEAMAMFTDAAGALAPVRDNVLVPFPSSGSEPPKLPLTLRERDILRLVAAGRSNQEIADELVLSVRTVERHLYNIYNKIGASGKSARAAAAVYASTRRLA